ncbi:MAG: serine/threonine protein kinase [Planctomycetales bacterium]|nr:serine/threonine protein kinase [Planctomycetales bacterium]
MPILEALKRFLGLHAVRRSAPDRRLTQPPHVHQGLGGGQRPDDRWQLLEEICCGQTTAVYAARTQGNLTPLAVKLLLRITEPNRNRFAHEIQMLRKLTGLATSQLHSSGVLADGTPFIAMPLVKGITLQSYSAQSGALPVDQCLRILLPLCDVLSQLHSLGITHGDLKPGNVMVDVVEDRLESLTIIDFGLASEAGIVGHSDSKPSTLSDGVPSRSISGTPLFISPEAAGGEFRDERSDIYSFGCTAYFLLTGAPPFIGRTPIEICWKHKYAEIPQLTSHGTRTIPMAMAKLIGDCLAKNPDHRPQSATEVHRRLTAINA